MEALVLKGQSEGKKSEERRGGRRKHLGDVGQMARPGEPLEMH